MIFLLCEALHTADHMIYLWDSVTLAPGRGWWRLFQIREDILITFSSWPSQNTSWFCCRWMESIQSALFTADPGPGLSQKRHACILRYEIFITRGGEMRDVSIFHSLLKLYYCCVTTEAKKSCLHSAAVQDNKQDVCNKYTLFKNAS